MLTPGSRLGPYEVTALLGRGGMGEVYRAYDTRLGRSVALKILPPVFATDPERLARFEREAMTLAALNHPNIAQIHGIEDSSSVPALVIELVEGQDLAERLTHGPLTVDEARPIARQIADALEAAHQAGIVHRDLKPANVKLRPDGAVKVLDFGLAKTIASNGAASASGSQAGNVSELTVTSPAATTLGVVLGTVSYMAPEQAKGQVVDKRADVWAFGCVLYEMLTSKRAYGGETVTEAIANVIKGDPDWNALPLSTPPGIRRLLRRCLQRDPKQRLRDIGDARLELDDEAEEIVVQRSVAALTPRWRLAALVTLAMVAAAAAAWSLTRPRGEVATVPTRFALDLAPFGLTNGPADRSPHLSISPDGTRLVFVGARGGQSQLWMRSLDSFEPTPIAGTQGAHSPFFSPDGQWVAFASDSKLRKVSLAGGTPVPLCDVGHVVQGGSWSADGTIVIGGRQLLRVSASGGTPVILRDAEPQSRVSAYRWPQLTPRAAHVLYTEVGADHFDIVAQSLASGERKGVVKSASSPMLLESGSHLLYAQQVSDDSGDIFGGMFIVNFDVNRLEIVGQPFPLSESVLVRRGGVAEITIARTGTAAYMTPFSREGTLMWIDRDGKSRTALQASADYGFPRLSPDGRSIALTIRGANRGLFVLDIERGTRRKLSTVPGEDEWPVWSPDGTTLAFTSDERGEIFSKPNDPTAPQQRLADVGLHLHLLSWSPDGRFLAYEEHRPDTGWDLGLLDVTSRKTTTLLQTAFEEYDPAFSPDGRWLAYASNHTGRFEVYVVPFPAMTPRSQVSNNGGRHPKWRRDGRELYFRRANGFNAVEVSLTPAFRVDRSQPLFVGQYQAEYDVAADGSRFLALTGRAAEDAADDTTGVNVVTNWFDDLKRRIADHREERH